MPREVILFYNDDTFKVYHDRSIAEVSKEELKKTLYALVSIQSGEVQKYLPIDPDYLITSIEPGKFTYSMEYFTSSMDSGEDPEFFPLKETTVDLTSIYDLYDAIYFIKEMSYVYDIMNPNQFDDFRVLDVNQAHISIPVSSEGPIEFHGRVKRSKIKNPRDLIVADIEVSICEEFGVVDDFSKYQSNHIRITGKNKWKFSESSREPIEGDELEVVAYLIDTGALIFANINILESLDTIYECMLTAYLYDKNAIEPDYVRANIQNGTDDMDSVLDDGIVGIIIASMISKSSVLSFILELSFIDICFKLTMKIHEYCGIDRYNEGVLYELSFAIEKKIPSEPDNPKGYLKSSIPTKVYFDLDIANLYEDTNTPLSVFLKSFERAFKGNFRFDDDVPF